MVRTLSLLPSGNSLLESGASLLETATVSGATVSETSHDDKGRTVLRSLALILCSIQNTVC